MKNKLTLITLGLLAISLFFNYSQKKEKEAYKTLINDQFKQRYLDLEHRLRQSEQQRLVLGDCLISTNLRSEAIRELTLKQDEELKKIKGRYNNHTPSELEIEMERRVK